MGRARTVRRLLGIASGIGLFAAGVAAGGLGPASADRATGGVAALPGFTRVVSLSHINDPARTPLFPGDPRFHIETAFTVADDGFFLEVVHEGMHTGTHYSAPCHFHPNLACAPELDVSDLVLPAAVIDVRDEVALDPDHVVTVADLRAWEADHGELPAGGAVLLLTGCSRFWADGDVDGEPNYYNCGSGMAGFHQPGFSRNAVRWLIETGVLGRTGALGTDTFGPDPSADASFTPTSLTLHGHRVTIENLTHLAALPPLGAWIVLGSPRNVHGSGAPGTVFAFLP